MKSVTKATDTQNSLLVSYSPATYAFAAIYVCCLSGNTYCLSLSSFLTA